MPIRDDDDTDDLDPDDREYPDAADMDPDDGIEIVDTHPCPHCGKTLYDEASICPQCGNFITYQSAENAPRRTPWWMIIAALICLLIILWFWVL